MKNPFETWFYRGREARGLGKPRMIKDSRLSAASRERFLAGWDEEDRFWQPTPTAEQIAESNSVVDRLKQFARTLKNPAAAP